MSIIKRKFFGMKQTGPSIAGYVTFFRGIVNQLDPDYASDEIKLHVFLNGLKANVSGNVRSLKPQGLEDAISIALSYDNPNVNRAPGNRHTRDSRNQFNSNHLGSGYSPMDIDEVQTKHYSTYECYNCHKRGHIQAHCPSRRSVAAGVSGSNDSSKDQGQSI